MSWDAPPPQQPGEPIVPLDGWTLPPPPPQQPAAVPWGQYGSPGGFYPAPPKRSRTGLYVGLGVGVGVVAIGLAIGIAVGSSNSTGSPSASGITATATASAPSSAAASPTAAASTAASRGARTVVLPAGAGPLHLLTNSDTASRVAELKSKLSDNAVYSDPRIGFYGIGSSSSFSAWLLAESTTDIAAFQDEVRSLGPDGAAREIAAAAKMTDLETESPGPLGGALLCGTLPEGSVRITACEWVDDSSFGWVYFLPSVGHGKAIGYTLELRGAVEQPG
jgi:hypothetical protein